MDSAPFVTINGSYASYIRSLSLQDIESLRVVLRGGSSVDLKRFNLHNRSQIATLLRVNGYDITASKDQSRVLTILKQAINYLETYFQYTFPKWVRSVDNVVPIFETASQWSPPHEHQHLCCTLLKVMNVINHLDARDRLFQCAIDYRDLYHIAQNKLETRLDNIRRRTGINFQFSSSQKSRESMITKLLAKEEHTAAQIFDRVRFKIVTSTRDDLLPILVAMMNDFLPFNYVIPGETVNNLVDIIDTIKHDAFLSKTILPQLEIHADLESLEGTNRWQNRRLWNEFSGNTYRDLNCIFDLPIRLNRYYCALDKKDKLTDGDLVFVMVECQIVDQESEMNNQIGENSHENYKRRQMEQIRKRLS